MLTYHAWNEYADMLADALASRGLGSDDVIAVRCANRLEWAVIALACSKIDARLMTLDPELPPRRSAPASLSRPPVPETGTSLITVPLHRVWGPVQFWAALVAGRSICLSRTFEPAAVLETIRKRRVTHWSAMPDSFEQLRELGADAVRAANTSSLRELEIGGAPATASLKAWVGDLFAPILSEAYGSTETGRISTMPFSRRAEKPGSCGRPVRGASVEIRDEVGQRLPVGAIGEIWARTQRSLECDLPTASPRARRDADGFVATGDVGRIDEDGFIYITGKAAGLTEPDMRHAG